MIVCLWSGCRSRPGDSVEYPDDDLAAEFVDGRWQYRRKDGQPY